MAVELNWVASLEKVLLLMLAGAFIGCVFDAKTSDPSGPGGK
jgi:hypothetical protein